MTMPIDRRAALKTAAAGMVAATAASGRAAESPNEKIVLGIIGVRGRGFTVGTGFAQRPDCEVAWLADPDSSQWESKASAGYARFLPTEYHLPRAESFARIQGKQPQLTGDLRRVLDDQNVDAIVVATPDHWHALATVWGCQAGKHVYVEKPASHSPWEGRKMVEAARKYDRVVQLGTQSRSAPYMIEAKRYIDEGKLGPIHLCKVFDHKRWGNVKRVADGPTPPHLDWNIWTGPAPAGRYNFNAWEHWNHFWRYSGGDIINDSIHQLDLARWLTGRDYPRSVYSHGGRWAEEGAFDTPDTQVAVYDFGDMLMTFEMTLFSPYMINADQALRDGDMFPDWLQNTSRIELYGTKGLMVVGRHGGGWQVLARPKSRQRVVVEERYGRWSDREHREDFVDAIRRGRRPNADIEEGHRSTLLSQFANISYRVGGQKLLVDAETESFTNSPEGNGLLKREYRAPWIVPEQV